MARRSNILALPGSTMIEVVATKGEKCIKKKMTIDESRKLKRSKGWNYQNYQLNYCTIKEKK